MSKANQQALLWHCVVGTSLLGTGGEARAETRELLPRLSRDQGTWSRT